MTAPENELGPIASSYAELQGLGMLRQAREESPMGTASSSTTLRAILQTVELTLWNLIDLVDRSTTEARVGALGRAVTHWNWIIGFHQVLVTVALTYRRLALPVSSHEERSVLDLQASPALSAYRDALERFDAAILVRERHGQLDIRRSLASQSLDDNSFRLLHYVRLAAHQSLIWEELLASVTISMADRTYEEVVRPALIREAVFERRLKGDTYFTQFRGLHQVNEILGEEANDHLAEAVHHLQAGQAPPAFEHLRIVNLLLPSMLVALEVMAFRLSTADYHHIRENLGLTSGSHSAALHYHLFRDLYHQLASSLQRLGTARFGSDEPHRATEWVHTVEGKRAADPDAWSLHLVVDGVLELRTALDHWRQLHLHLPRNNLGGPNTTSLTGSPDGLNTVRKLREKAKVHDPLNAVFDQRMGCAMITSPAPARLLRDYLASDLSLDRRLLEETGKVTRERFAKVQERTGIFGEASPFVPPPRRTV